VESELNKS